MVKFDVTGQIYCFIATVVMSVVCRVNFQLCLISDISSDGLNHKQNIQEFVTKRYFNIIHYLCDFKQSFQL